MAKIVIAVKAQISLKDFMLYSEEEFGQKALKNLKKKVNQKIKVGKKKLTHSFTTD